MMYKFLISFLLIMSFGLVAESCDQFNNLSFEQQFNLRKAYYYGKPDGYSYTLAAIALVESSAGKFRLNIRSNDLGLFQINATTAQNTLGVTNYFRQIELHQRLIYDDLLGAKIAIEVLEHFRRNRPMSNQVWQEMIKSYNEGSRWRRDKASRKKAESYLDNVRQSVRMLQQCMPMGEKNYEP